MAYAEVRSWGPAQALIAAAGGVGMAFLLFAAVAAMVQHGGRAPETAVDMDTMAFVQVRPEPPAPPPEELPPEPPPPPAEPPPPPTPLPASGLVGGLALAPAAPHLHLNLSGAPDLAGLPRGETREVVAVSTPRPTYPVRAQRLGLSGKVVVEFTVDESGAVRDPRIVEADPPGVFDRAVLRGVRRWSFKPRQEDGRPVAVRIRQTVVFTPGEDG